LLITIEPRGNPAKNKRNTPKTPSFLPPTNGFLERITQEQHKQVDEGRSDEFEGENNTTRRRGYITVWGRRLCLNSCQLQNKDGIDYNYIHNFSDINSCLSVMQCFYHQQLALFVACVGMAHFSFPLESKPPRKAHGFHHLIDFLKAKLRSLDFSP
jgi:hypothetical protein